MMRYLCICVWISVFFASKISLRSSENQIVNACPQLFDLLLRDNRTTPSYTFILESSNQFSWMPSAFVTNEVAEHVAEMFVVLSLNSDVSLSTISGANIAKTDVSWMSFGHSMLIRNCQGQVLFTVQESGIFQPLRNNRYFSKQNIYKGYSTDLGHLIGFSIKEESDIYGTNFKIISAGAASVVVAVAKQTLSSTLSARMGGMWQTTIHIYPQTTELPKLGSIYDPVLISLVVGRYNMISHKKRDSSKDFEVKTIKHAADLVQNSSDTRPHYISNFFIWLMFGFSLVACIYFLLKLVITIFVAPDDDDYGGYQYLEINNDASNDEIKNQM